LSKAFTVLGDSQERAAAEAAASAARLDHSPRPAACPQPGCRLINSVSSRLLLLPSARLCWCGGSPPLPWVMNRQLAPPDRRARGRGAAGGWENASDGEREERSRAATAGSHTRYAIALLGVLVGGTAVAEACCA